MYFRRRKFLRRPRRKILRRRGGFRKKSGLKRMIKKMISRKQETKVYTNASGNNGIFDQSSATTLQSNCWAVIPSIVSGTGDGQRIADRIDIKKFKISGQLNLATTSMPQSAWSARLILFSCKDINQANSGNALPAIEANNFFRSGGGTGSVAGYAYWDQYVAVNKNRIIVHGERHFTLGCNITPTTTAGNYPNATPTDRPYHKFTFNVAKKMKRFTYDENASYPNLPLNHNLWLAVIVNRIDNTANTGTTTPVYLSYCQDFEFKDA